MLAGILATVALALPGCSSKEQSAPEPVVTVQVATAQKRTIENIITADALLYPLHQATIVPKVSAPVAQFYVTRGSQVHAGQLLAVLENKDLSATVVESKGAYEQAQATYATSTRISLPAQLQAAQLAAQETKQAMDAAQAVYQSRLRLYKAGAIARNLMNQSLVAAIQARNKYRMAASNLKALQSIGEQQQLKSAEAALTSAKGKYLGAEAQLDYSKIRSPIDGVVTTSPLYPGEMASAGSPLVTIMNVSHVVARAPVSPQQASQLHVGDPASISVAPSQPAAPGKITVVSPAIDPNATTVQVWADAPNPKGRLKVGSTVELSIVAQRVKNALVIPSGAVLTAADGTTSVMVVGADGKAHQANVKTGIRQGDEVQITSGLQAGERVVTEGAYGLPDGTKVKF
jgi:HlyD family secretion protein